MPKSLLNHSDGVLTDTWGRRNRRLANRRCLECGYAFRPLDRAQRYCSRPCARKKNGGQNRKPETWWTNSKGYIEGKVWISGKQVRMKKHRWIYEQYLGRPLMPTENIHHVNGNKQDNRLENLQLMQHGQHSTRHNLLRSNKAEGRD